MEFFFNPKGIALIGATPNKLKGGYAILKNLITGFKGGIYPVNPRYTTIEGLRCYPSVADVPDPADLAIVFVPADSVPDIISDCAARGIPGVMIESGGFAESAAGKKFQNQMLDIAKRTGVRLWGPNCMGLVDAVRRYVFSFVSPSIWDDLVPGDVSLIVQSGMLSGAFLMDIMTRGIMGVNRVCSIGNKTDVNECELLEYLMNDPDTRAIGLYLESFADGRRFMEICRRSSKPVVVLKGGKSPRGAAAALSHTASLAGNTAVVKGALAQAGVIEAKDFNQMMDLCRTLAIYPDIHTKGDGRIAILTYTGGAGIVSSDFIDETNLELAELTPAALTALKEIFPEWMQPGNPVDLWPAVEKNGAEKAYGAALKAVLDDPNVDAVFIHAFTGGFALTLEPEWIRRMAKDAGKPVFCWLLGKNEETRNFQIKARTGHIPVFQEIGRSVECMDAVFARKRMLKSHHHPSFVEASDLPVETIRPIMAASGLTILDEHLSRQVLAHCSIPVVEDQVVVSGAEARKAAEKTGFPVVMKGLVPGMLHKTEAGMVHLNIFSPDDAEHHFNLLETAVGSQGKIVVQKQIHSDLELIAGLHRDPQFGPCIMIGFGGTMAEVIEDAAFAIAPVDLTDAMNLIDRLKKQKLLNGFRGAAAVDRKALARILASLSRLGCIFPNIKEIDINPIVICQGSPLAVDASIILDEGGAPGI
jgi:acetyltransferase